MASVERECVWELQASHGSNICGMEVSFSNGRLLYGGEDKPFLREVHTTHSELKGHICCLGQPNWEEQ